MIIICYIIELQYRSAYERDPNILNVIFIILSLPVLGTPEFIGEPIILLLLILLLLLSLLIIILCVLLWNASMLILLKSFLILYLACVHCFVVEQAFPEFLKAITHLPLQGQKALVQVLVSLGEDYLKSLLIALQTLITIRICSQSERWSSQVLLNNDDHVTCAAKVCFHLHVH